MSEIHRVLELLGTTVASLLDRVESLEKDNEALRLLFKPPLNGVVTGTDGSGAPSLSSFKPPFSGVVTRTFKTAN
jgi:hypothetical protein